MLQPLDVVLLQAVRSYPSVSLLLTRSGSPALDRGRLRALLDAARDRLAREPDGAGVDLLPTLRGLADGIDPEGEGPAVALFASAEVALAVELPTPVPDRVVVDDTFATRDLVHALQRQSPTWALVLDERTTRLYRGLGETFAAVRDDGFPLEREREAPAPAEREHGRRQDGLRRYVAEVDAALEPHLGADRAPLLVLGAPRRVSAFARRSRWRARLARTIAVVPSDPSAATVAVLVGPVLAERQRDEQAEALTRIGASGGPDRCASGLDAAWRGASEGRGALLVVEEGYAVPGLVDGAGDIAPAPDPEHPEAVDDLVDELVETVLAHRGRAVFVPDGSLTDRGRVALQLRY